MKKLGFIFTALAFVAGMAVISCTKENAPAKQAITVATDAIQIDYTASEITGLIEDYESLNGTAFADPTLKAGVVDNPMTMPGMSVDNCATVSMLKTPSLTDAGLVKGATITFKIDFGTTGCLGKDGKARRGTITSTYTWVKEGGWSRESVINVYVSDVHYEGTQSSTYGVIGTFKHAYYTEKFTLKVIQKDGSWKQTVSERQRELMEGNGGVNPIRIFKITGKSTFTNSNNETSTYTISATDPLIKRSDCKTFTSGTVTNVNNAGITTTITYTVAGQTCPDGFTIKTPGDKDGKGAMSQFIKFGK